MRGKSFLAVSRRSTKNLMTKFWREKSNFLEEVPIKMAIRIQVEIFSPLLNNQIILGISKTRLMPNLKKRTSKQFFRAYPRSGSKIQITRIQISINQTSVFKGLPSVLQEAKNLVLKLLKQLTLEQTRDA